MKYLIVNADDFGQSPGINRGIVESFEHGIVTSSSLMVRWPAVSEACSYAKGNEQLSLGLHVDLGAWRKVDRGWHAVYEVVDIQDESMVRKEVARQLETFWRLMDRNPSHLDSHQHLHVSKPAVKEVLTEFALDIGIPLRRITPAVGYCGDFYGQDRKGRPNLDPISPNGLIEILHSLPDGITELACHPGYIEDLDTMYRTERAIEVATLTDDRVLETISQINVRLCSFNELPQS